MKRTLIALALCATTTFPGAGFALEVQHQGGIAYISGGVGLSEREELKAQEKDYTLILLLATKEGPYLSGTPVEVLDAKGTSLLTATSEGPFFYAKLPAGNYTVKAGSEPSIKSEKVAITANSSKVLRFYW